MLQEKSSNQSFKKPLCPKCKGPNISPIGRDRKGFSVGKAVAGGILTGGIGTLAGFSGKKGKLEYYCSDCGNVFKSPYYKTDKTDKKNTEKNKKTLIIIAIIFIFLGLIIAMGGGNKKTNPNNITSEKNQTTAESDEALRKCIVMEAADIYNTGIGGNPDTAFEDARKTCEGWLLNWGEEEFVNLSQIDWENRKEETIDGKTLQYYLEELR